jgi:hypothetical protein
MATVTYGEWATDESYMLRELREKLVRAALPLAADPA